MNDIRKIFLAILVLIGLVVWLVILSYNKQAQIDKNSLAIQSLDTSIKQLSAEKDKLYKLLNIRPTNGKDGTSCTTTQLSNGASVSCTDGTSSLILNGKATKAKDGKDGNNGKSAYELWLEQGNLGSLQDFLDSLKGVEGIPARNIVLRCNSSTLENEWKYEGTFYWYPLDKVTECVQ